MKIITKFMLTLAMLVVGVGGAKATKLYATYGNVQSSGSFDSGTGVYTWTAGWSNMMDLFSFGSGELGNFTELHFSTSDYTTGSYRMCFQNGGSTLAEILFYSAGDKTIYIDAENNKIWANVDDKLDCNLSNVTNIRFGGKGYDSSNGTHSITITKKPYLQKPMELVWGDDGNAEIDITDLTATGGFSLNEQTGELTGKGESGSLKINFPSGGVDLTSLTGFSVTYTGDNLFNNFEIGDGTTNKGFWSNVTGRNDLNQHMTAENVGNPAAITNWKWNSNSTAGTMTITSIKLKASVVTASNPHETLLTSAMFVGVCESHFGESVGQGTTIYGNGSVLAAQYADLSEYDEMHIYGTPNKMIRLLFNWSSANQKEIAGDDVKLNSDGYYSLDLKSLPAQQLNAFKFPWDGQTGIITKVILYKASVPVAYSYVFSGSGAFTPSVTAALEDATATSYDATGVTGTGIGLVAENPNALFIANEGQLTNTTNVIVNGTCANLVLTDQKPFKTPSAFTATNADFTKTVSDAGYATMVIPFDAALPEGVLAYNITGSDGDKLVKEDAESIKANKPVMLKNNGTFKFTATNAAIAATPDGVVANGLLCGVYNTTVVPAEGYVLQSQDKGVNFYKAGETGVEVNAFRAYLADATTTRLFFNLDDDVTGISEAAVSSEAADSEIYNLNGQRVANAQKGLYIVGGKKVMVK